MHAILVATVLLGQCTLACVNQSGQYSAGTAFTSSSVNTDDLPVVAEMEEEESCTNGKREGRNQRERERNKTCREKNGNGDQFLSYIRRLSVYYKASSPSSLTHHRCCLFSSSFVWERNVRQLLACSSPDEAADAGNKTPVKWPVIGLKVGIDANHCFHVEDEPT